MFVVTGLLLVIVGVGQRRFQLRALKTIGIVVQHIEERRWDEGYYTIPCAVMHYMVHGRTYELRTSRTSRSMTDYPLGLVVDIAYDPGNTGDAQLWMSGRAATRPNEWRPPVTQSASSHPCRSPEPSLLVKT